MRIGVIGGGLFGLVSAVTLLRSGHKVTVFEASRRVLEKASWVNQARLHTGMHYPRDLETAKAAKSDYEIFTGRFPNAVREIMQFYAVHRDSELAFSDFLAHAEALQLDSKIVESSRFFRPGRVQGMLLVPEATFDMRQIRDSLVREFSELGGNLELDSPIVRVQLSNEVVFETRDGIRVFDRGIVATYSTLERFGKQLDISMPPLQLQLAQVVLGYIPNLRNTGITVMDGPFWSTMPFGLGDLHSLTDVAKTPVYKSDSGLLECQTQHTECGVSHLHDCSSCSLSGALDVQHFVSSMASDLNEEFQFQFVKRLVTVKSLLDDAATQATAARPTSLLWDQTRRVALLHSGKVGSSIRYARFIDKEFSQS